MSSLAGKRSGRQFVERSARVEGRPDLFRNYVQYAVDGFDSRNMAAQFHDISDTGMRLISRFPTKAKVGDFLSVEFTLPGTSAPIRNQARVVRMASEYDSAIRFLNFEEPLKKAQLRDAVRAYDRFVSRSSLFGFANGLIRWTDRHRHGLVLSAIAFAFATAVGTYIHLHSDAYQGAKLRAWGQDLPKQWFKDYVNRFNK